MRKGNRVTILILLLLIGFLGNAQQPDSICGRKVVYDESGKILSWYSPEMPGAGYNHVIKLASEFLLDTPTEPQTGLPMYYVTCCFKGPHMTPDKSFVARRWINNPACVFAGSVQSFAVQYYAYTGDRRYIQMVREMLDYQLEHGTTPENFSWGNVPYASANPFETEYYGATWWQGRRGDGYQVIEPDKVGELGYAYLKFYQITEETKYLEAAIHCADALAKNIREIKPVTSDQENYEVRIGMSPWPFRVNARTGEIFDQYCSNVLEPVKLFRELIRIQKQINLSEEECTVYKNATEIAWNWLYGKNGPLRTFVWNGYFEDVDHDPQLANRVQITPVELAKYLTVNPEHDKNPEVHVPALLYYAVSAFKTEGMDAMNEQLWCYRPMGSHSARYASACALWYEKTANEWFKDQTFRYLNTATYMTYDNGVVAVGPDYLASWFSDGYSDYVRHFIDVLAAVPEWAPADENHMLRSSSVVQGIEYNKEKIQYSTYAAQSTQKFRLINKPSKIMAGDRKIKESSSLQNEGWTWEKLNKGGVLTIHSSDENSKTKTIIF
uniref:hypothetical protein n=1 Tax=uncultured Draconibacterium sp. TaxID=1573823 RepID=UPI00321636E7